MNSHYTHYNALIPDLSLRDWHHNLEVQRGGDYLYSVNGITYNLDKVWKEKLSKQLSQILKLMFQHYEDLMDETVTQVISFFVKYMCGREQ